MINDSYSKKILNALFHTGGSVGKTAEEEKQELIANGAISSFRYNNEVVYGKSPDMYRLAFNADDYNHGGQTAQNLDAGKTEVAKTGWWSVKDTDEVLHEYEIEVENSKGEKEKVKKTTYVKGWYIVKESNDQVTYYPSDTYLGLFTQMPDEYGNNYKEPEEGTTYIRVNLHADIITGDNCLNNARKDSDDGKSFVNNKRNIMFPEVCYLDWGNIIGFGIFESEEARSGDTPILWGRLNNENGISATVDHVPLFRTKEFQINLQ